MNDCVSGGEMTSLYEKRSNKDLKLICFLSPLELMVSPVAVTAPRQSSGEVNYLDLISQ